MPHRLSTTRFPYEPAAHQYADLDAEILQNTIDNQLEGLTQLVERLQTAVVDAGH